MLGGSITEVYKWAETSPWLESIPCFCPYKTHAHTCHSGSQALGARLWSLRESERERENFSECLNAGFHPAAFRFSIWQNSFFPFRELGTEYNSVLGLITITASLLVLFGGLVKVIWLNVGYFSFPFFLRPAEVTHICGLFFHCIHCNLAVNIITFI